LALSLFIPCVKNIVIHIISTHTDNSVEVQTLGTKTTTPRHV